MSDIDFAPIPEDPKAAVRQAWRIQRGAELLVWNPDTLIQFRGTPLKATRRWNAAVERLGECIVIVAPRADLEFGGAPDINLLVRQGLVYGGWAKVSVGPTSTLSHDQVTGFDLIPRDPGRMETFILDNNVLIEMEQFYMGKMIREQHEQRRSNLRSLMIFLCGRDVVPGLALTESGQGPLGLELAKEKRAPLVRMYSALASLDHFELDELFQRNAIPVEVLPSDNRWNARAVEYLQADPGEQWDIRRRLSPGYAIFLRTMQLTPPAKRFRSEVDRLERWERLTRWVVEVLPYIPAFEFNVATEWFLRSRRPATIVRPIEGLLKFPEDRKRKLSAAWGAAWDLTFIRTLYEQNLVQANHPVLVTGEKSLRSIKEDMVTPVSPGSSMTLMNLRLDPLLERHRPRIMQALSRITDVQQKRRSTAGPDGPDPAQLEQASKRAIEISGRLESEILAGSDEMP